METANTILNQLGGNKFIAMTGSKNFAATQSSLSMKLSKNISNATHLTITLNSIDLYDVKFISCRNSQLTVIKEYNGVYADMLQNIFTTVTGLDTHL